MSGYPGNDDYDYSDYEWEGGDSAPAEQTGTGGSTYSGDDKDYWDTVNQAEQYSYENTATPEQVEARREAGEQSYWDDPDRVARYYNAIESQPPGAPPPDWINPDDIRAMYEYYKQANTGTENWWEWKPLAPDDPMRETIAQMPTPPREEMQPEEIDMASWSRLDQFLEANDLRTATLDEYYKLPEEVRTQIPIDQLERTDTGQLIVPKAAFDFYTPGTVPAVTDVTQPQGISEEAWNRMTWWHKVLYSSNGFYGADSALYGSVGGAIGEVVEGGVKGGMSLKSIGRGGLVGGIFGTTMMIANTWQEPWKNKMVSMGMDPQMAEMISRSPEAAFWLLDYPSVFTERTLGMLSNLGARMGDPEKYGSVAEFFGEFQNLSELMRNISMRHEAADLTYEGSRLSNAEFIPDAEFMARMQAGTLTAEDMARKDFDPQTGKMPGKWVVRATELGNPDPVVWEVPNGLDPAQYLMEEAYKIRQRVGDDEAKYQEEIEKLRSKTGIEGNFADLVLSSALDPQNIINPAFGVAKLGLGALSLGEKATGKTIVNPTIKESFAAPGMDTVDKALINAGVRLRTEFTPEELASRSFITRYVAGVDKDGNVKRLAQPKPGIWNYVTGLTPQARALDLVLTVGNGMKLVMDQAKSADGTFDIEAFRTMLHGIVGDEGYVVKTLGEGKFEVEYTDAKGMKQARPIPAYFRSAEAAAIAPAIQSAVRKIDELAKQYSDADKPRQVLEQVAELMGLKPSDMVKDLASKPDADADVMYRQFEDSLVKKIAEAAGEDVDAMRKRLMSMPLDPLGKYLEQFKGVREAQLFMNLRLTPTEFGLNGARLKRYAEMFTGNGAKPFTSYDFYQQAVALLTTDSADYARQHFGLKPEHGIIQWANAIKKVQSYLLLNFSPSYVLNNAIDAGFKLAYEGLLPNSFEDNRKFWSNTIGAMPERLAEGWNPAAMGEQFGVSEYSAEARKALSEALKSKGLLPSLGQALGGGISLLDKMSFAAKLSGWTEKQASIMAMTSAAREFSHAWKPRQMDQSLKDKMSESQATDLFRALHTLNSAEIDAIALTGQIKNISLRSALPADDVRILDGLFPGEVDRLDEAIQRATSESEARILVRQAREEVTSKLRDEIVRHVEEIANRAVTRAQTESIQGAIDMLDNAMQVYGEFWLAHDDKMAAIAKQAEALDEDAAADLWDRTFYESDRDFAIQRQIFEAKWDGAFRGLGGEFNIADSHAAAMNLLKELHQNNMGFYLQRRDAADIYNGERRAANRKAETALRNLNLTEGERAAIKEQAIAAKRDAWYKFQSTLNEDYVGFILGEDKIQMELDALFAKTFGQQFAQHGELYVKMAEDNAMVWRSAIRAKRREQAAAESLFRNGDLHPELRKAWGGKVVPDDVLAKVLGLNGGLELYKLAPDVRHEAQKVYRAEVHKMYIRQQIDAAHARPPVAPTHAEVRDIESAQAAAEHEAAVAAAIARVNGKAVSVQDVPPQDAPVQDVLTWDAIPVQPDVEASAAPAVETQPGVVDGVIPTMMTQEMRAQLGEIGFSPEEIRNMTPADAWKNINEGVQRRQNPDVRDAAQVKELIDTIAWLKEEIERYKGEIVPDNGDWGIVNRNANAAEHVEAFTIDLQNAERELADLQARSGNQPPAVDDRLQKQQAIEKAREYSQKISGNMDRQKFHALMRERYGLKEAAAINTLADMFAAQWAKREGIANSDRWYRKAMFDISMMSDDAWVAREREVLMGKSIEALARQYNVLVDGKFVPQRILNMVNSRVQADQRYTVLDEVPKTVLVDMFEAHAKKYGEPSYLEAPKGEVQFAKDGKALVRLMDEADVSTVIHEMGHIFRRYLSRDDIDIVAKWSGLKDGAEFIALTRKFADGTLKSGDGADYGRYVEAEEKFARGLEAYLRGENPMIPAEVKSVFDQIRDMMAKIYKVVTGSSIDVKVSPEMKDLYDRMLWKDSAGGEGIRNENYIKRPDQKTHQVGGVFDSTVDKKIAVFIDTGQRLGNIDTETLTAELKDYRDRVKKNPLETDAYYESIGRIEEVLRFREENNGLLQPLTAFDKKPDKKANTFLDEDISYGDQETSHLEAELNSMRKDIEKRHNVEYHDRYHEIMPDIETVLNWRRENNTDSSGGILRQENQAERAGASSSADVEAAIKAWREMGVESPWFKKWFGESKVLGLDGNPIVMYHGSRQTFEEFDPWYAGRGTDPGYFGKGFYFTPIQGLANYYGNQVYEVYLNVTNPYKVYNRQELYEALGTKNPEEIARKLQEMGHDGLFVMQREMPGVTNTVPFSEVLVFKPDQIKAVQNRGTFDESGNILRQNREPWQMGREEYVRSQQADEFREEYEQRHRQALAGAIARGEDVPAEAFKDYAETGPTQRELWQRVQDELYRVDSVDYVPDQTLRQVAPPYSYGSRDYKKFVSKLSPEARNFHSLFEEIYLLGIDGHEKPEKKEAPAADAVDPNVSEEAEQKARDEKPYETRYKTRNETATYMTAEVWNKLVNDTDNYPEYGEKARRAVEVIRRLSAVLYASNNTRVVKSQSMPVGINTDGTIKYETFTYETEAQGAILHPETKEALAPKDVLPMLMRMNEDGTINPSDFEKEFRMERSLMQRVVDALAMQEVSNVYAASLNIDNLINEMKARLDAGTITQKSFDDYVERLRSDNPGQIVLLPVTQDGGMVKAVGGEAYRKALTYEIRELYRANKLNGTEIGALRKDIWGALGSISKNEKTVGSIDFTTLCPQMFFNKGCWYCYRRSALLSGINNKLVAERAWYVGDILRLKDEDIDMLNSTGGLRIQSFGDWQPHFESQLADVLTDARLRGLDVKIITKEPEMIEVIARMMKDAEKRGEPFNNIFFNISSDYHYEPYGTRSENWAEMNMERVKGKTGKKENYRVVKEEDGTVSRWWKRALSVEEAYAYREKYPWVNVRVVVTTVDDYIRALIDPRVQVITGYHGRDFARNGFKRLDAETGEFIVHVEPLGDAGMPVFDEYGMLSTDGKNVFQRELARRIIELNLEEAYLSKSCCITGKCLSCTTRCGAANLRPIERVRAAMRNLKDPKHIEYILGNLDDDSASNKLKSIRAIVDKLRKNRWTEQGPDAAAPTRLGGTTGWSDTQIKAAIERGDITLAEGQTIGQYLATAQRENFAKYNEWRTEEARRSYEQLGTNSPYFRTWWHGSAAYRGSGKKKNPLELYINPGTLTRFDAESGTPGPKMGMIFSSEPPVETGAMQFIPTGVYLSVKRPYTMTWDEFNQRFVDGNQDVNAFLASIRGSIRVPTGGAKPVLARGGQPIMKDGQPLMNMPGQVKYDRNGNVVIDKKTGKPATNPKESTAEKGYYDGIRIRGERATKTKQGRPDMWIVFSGDQVKSVLNTGEFKFDTDQRFRQPKDPSTDEPLHPNLEGGPAVAAPLGTGDEMGTFPREEALIELFLSRISNIFDNAESTISQDVRNKRLGAQAGFNLDDLPPDVQAAALKYINQVKADAGTFKAGMIKYAEARRDQALLNYNSRRGFDNLLGAISPYEFWYTRSALLWMLRAISRPEIMANYYRVNQFLERSTEEKEGFPTRLKGKLFIPVPGVDGGGVYIDPMKNIFSFDQMLRPFADYAQQLNMEARKTEEVLRKLVDDEQITQAQANEALKARSGPLWDKAMAQARNEVDGDVKNPMDLLFSVYAPSLPLSIAMAYRDGRQDQISMLPISRTIMNATGALGMNEGRGYNIEAPFRRTFGLPERGSGDDPAIDRMLSNMTANGEITYDQARMAMIKRQGPEFDRAAQMASSQQRWKWITAPIQMDFYPAGEQRQRALNTEYKKAAEAYEQGDRKAKQKFLEKYPELRARWSSFEEPEERLYRYLQDEVWRRWNELPDLYQKQISQQLGRQFTQGFLAKETRERQEPQTLAAWAELMGKAPGMNENIGMLGEMVGGLPAGMQPEVAPLGEAQLYQNYLDEKNQRFPNIGKTQEWFYGLPESQQKIYRKTVPELDEYSNWKADYLAKNPGVIPHVQSEKSELYGLPVEVQQGVYQYQSERNQKYPGIFDLQEKYFSLTDKDRRSAFLKQNPELGEYWDWRREFAAAVPRAAVYILGESGITNALTKDEYSNEKKKADYGGARFKPQDISPLTMEALFVNEYGGRPLSVGALKDLEFMWEKAGKPAGDLQSFIDLLVKPAVFKGSRKK